MRLRIGTFVLAMLAVTGAATQALAVAVPLLDPGFDIYNAGTLTLVPDNRIPNQSAPVPAAGRSQVWVCWI